MADLVLATAAQIVGAQGAGAGAHGPGDLLGHGGPVAGQPQQVVQAAVGPVIGGWFQSQEIWEEGRVLVALAYRVDRLALYQALMEYELNWLIEYELSTTWEKKTNVTTHDVVQLYVFKGWNFSLEFEGGAVAQEDGLNERKGNKAVGFFELRDGKYFGPFLDSMDNNELTL